MKNVRPPRWIQYLLQKFCDQSFLEEIEGDLEELYYQNVDEKGIIRANWLYFFDALPHFNPYFLRRIKFSDSNNFLSTMAMLKNYLLIYVRNLIRQKTQSFINIFGLALGLTAFGLIFIWVNHELSFDAFHTKKDRIYRINGTVKTETEIFQHAVTSLPLGPQLMSDFPEVEKIVRFGFNDALLKKETTVLTEDKLMFTDSSYFEVFDFNLKEGDINTALSKPYQIVLSESMARRYFGSKNPIGETLTIYLYDPGQNGAEYLITGVMEDCPENTQLQYEAIGSFSTIESAHPNLLTEEGWYWNRYYTYLLLNEESKAGDLQEKFPDFIVKYMSSEMDLYNIFYEFDLQPLETLYLDSHMRYQLKTGSLQNLKVFTLIGCMLLLLAIINYVNLSTAVSLKKERLSGIRKVLGAKHTHLIIQHFTESILTALIALFIAICFMDLIKPIFYMVSGKQDIPFYTIETLSILIGTSLISGLLAGIYPAITFSRVNPLNNLKKATSKLRGKFFRRVLVTVQFIITFFLIVGVFVINQQYTFISEKDLGIDKENILVIKTNGDRNIIEKFEVFKNSLDEKEGIISVTGARTVPVGGLSNSLLTSVSGDGNKINSTMNRVRMDANYLKTYGIELIAGRNLNNSPSDTSSFLLNEAAVTSLGWESIEDAIGKQVEQDGIKGEVIGVVKNFHYNSLEHPLEPVSMYHNHGNISSISIRFKGDYKQTLLEIEQIWDNMFPEAYFDYYFFDDAVENQYQSVKRFTTLFHAFSILCLVIALMGLYGLLSFITEQRQKEIGIRKILGAPIKAIIWLISAEFTVLIALAMLIATPVGWIVMEQWLYRFSYRISLDIWIFLGAGLFVITVALFTGLTQVIRSTRVNPVTSLKQE